MNALGIERYHKNIRDAKNKSRESTTLYGVTLMKEALDVVCDGINAFLDDALSGKLVKTSDLSTNTDAS